MSGLWSQEEDLTVLGLTLLPETGATERASSLLTWRVERWNTTTADIRSPHFTCDGVKWRIHLWTQGDPNSSPRDSVSLYVDRGNFGATTNLPAICVQFSMIVSNPYNASIYAAQHMTKRMALGERECGFPRFCLFDQVLNTGDDVSAAVVQDGEADVTVVFRVMNDTTGNLWVDGVPTPSSTTPEISLGSGSSGNRLTASSPRSPFLTPFDFPIEPMASSSAASGSNSSQEAPKKEKPLPPSREALLGEECLVCVGEPPFFPSKSPTTVCSHEANICLACLRQHITAEINGKGAVDGIPCPAPDCKEVMDYHDIGIWADEETFTRYDRMLVRRAMGMEENFIFCSNAACEAGQIHSEGANAPIVTCYVCHHRTCFIHQVGWHEGHTCDEWDKEKKIRDTISTTAQYLSTFTKACPNCNKPIEKFIGCDSVTCKKPAGCGHQFCWACLAPYEPIVQDGNHKHRKDCKYYTPFNEPETDTPQPQPPVPLPLPPPPPIAPPSNSATTTAPVPPAIPNPPTALATPDSSNTLIVPIASATTSIVPIASATTPIVPITSVTSATSTTPLTPLTSSAIAVSIAPVTPTIMNTLPAPTASRLSSQSQRKAEKKWYRFW